ncbi:nonstructural protein [Microviridae sp.]|nr:nonstructural protein [Microviridae sp.]
MKVLVMAIYDNKAHFYNKPFYQINRQVAERTATDLVSDINTDVSKHPEDFILFELGEFDDATATFDLHDAPVPLFRFHEIQKNIELGETE